MINKNDCNREEFDLTITNAGNYFINLYRKLGTHSFFCPQLKIEMMLVISAMDYYSKYHKPMFSDMTRILNEPFGLKLSNNITFAPNVVMSVNMEERPLNDKEISSLKSNNIGNCDNSYYHEAKIDKYKKQTLFDVFVKYAPYPPAALSRILEEFKMSDAYSKYLNEINNKKDNRFYIPASDFYKILKNYYN